MAMPLRVLVDQGAPLPALLTTLLTEDYRGIGDPAGPGGASPRVASGSPKPQPPLLRPPAELEKAVDELGRLRDQHPLSNVLEPGRATFHRKAACTDRPGPLL